MLILTDTADSTVSYTTTVQVNAGVATYGFTDVLPGTYILSLDNSFEKIKLDDVLVTVSDSDTSKDISVIRNVFDITGTITSADDKADLSVITIMLLDSEGNELAQTEAEVTGESASYSFSDLREGSYTVRIDSDKVEAEDTAVNITDTDVTANIAVSLAYLIGDVNNDGIVDVLDAADIQKFTAERITEFKKKA